MFYNKYIKSKQQTPNVEKVMQGKTCPQLFLERVKASGPNAAFLVKRQGRYQPISWNEAYCQVRSLYDFLSANRGLVRGQNSNHQPKPP